MRCIVGLAVFLALLCPPGAAEGYWEVANIPYADRVGTRSNLTSLDLYVPDAGSGFPVVVWVHGGAWQTGDKRNVGYKPQAFTDAGYLMASVNYRLSPAVEHPAHAEDVAASLAWIYGHIDRYGGDPTQIFLTGHSAGAHLVALVATDERYLARHGLDLELIAGVVCLDGPYDIPARVAEGSPVAEANISRVFGESPEVWWDASPVAHADQGKGIPPFLVVTAGRWGVSYRQAERLVDALTSVGVSVDRHHAPDSDHFSLNRNLGRAGDPVTASVLEFFHTVRTLHNAGRPPALPWP